MFVFLSPVVGPSTFNPLSITNILWAQSLTGCKSLDTFSSAATWPASIHQPAEREREKVSAFHITLICSGSTRFYWCDVTVPDGSGCYLWPAPFFTHKDEERSPAMFSISQEQSNLYAELLFMCPKTFIGTRGRS